MQDSPGEMPGGFINSNLYYTFQATDNDYIERQGFTIIERSRVMYVDSVMYLKKSIPAWTGVKIGQINNWGHGNRTLGLGVSLHGINSVTIRITVDTDGNVIADTQGAADIYSEMWLYISNCFVI